MRLLVRGAHVGRYTQACAQFGFTPVVNQSMLVWFGPDDPDTLNEYVIPDQTPFVTWVAMKHPEWIHEIWSQGPLTVLGAPDDFLQIRAPNDNT